MEPCLLALDTSTDAMALAVQAPSGRRVLRVEAGGARASEHVLPLALRMLQEAGVSVEQLDAVAFGRGPGAFTGLRTACAVAQGLALGRGCPVLAVDSLCLVAEDARAHLEPAAARAPIWVAMDARMDEVYAASYLAGAHGWSVLQAPALYPLPALAERWRREPPRVIAGNAALRYGANLAAGGARLWSVEHDRAAALLQLARQAWVHGPHLGASDAVPLYLRDKVALTTAERSAARR